ncbi:MAG: AraC family transcriptional regulator [Lachnospiraceae bacterium]
MKVQTPDKIIQDICFAMGMIPCESNSVGCGVCLEGDGIKTEGFFWYLVHEDYFAITKCDFVFCSEFPVTMPDSSLYISLRLDYTNHLPPGKILSFMEEKGNGTNAVMRAGTRVAYTEVLYVPSFYKKHLDTAFTAMRADPVTILKNMGGEHNWPQEMRKVLVDVHESKLTGMSAELYFVAKAYELMAVLIAMGNDRFPKKNIDYEQILYALQYIDRNYTGKIKQVDLVYLSNMSSTKLKSVFRQFTGCTITEYIMEKKTDHAAHLLSDSDLSVEQIAKALGFGTATGFATSFKKQIGVSPSEYRKQIKFYCMKNPSEIENLSFENGNSS